MLSDYDRAHFQKIVDGEGDWFSAHLIRLYMRADQYNRANLASVYPEVKTAYEAWYAALNLDLERETPPFPPGPGFIESLIKDTDDALGGDSNDAEHDALSYIRDELAKMVDYKGEKGNGKGDYAP